MKRILLFTLILTLLLAGCGGTEEAPQTTNAPEAPASQATEAAQTHAAEAPAQGFTFTYQGTKIVMHAPAAPILEALGEPKKYTESASCAFEGLDKSYYYGSFYLDTYPVGEEDFVYGWWFADDSVATEEGIYIGASKAQVEQAYGADTFNGTNAYIVHLEGTVLTVILEEDVVSSIQYAIELD